jgi:glycosyltransferase involved in cell wall biosynthesis
MSAPDFEQAEQELHESKKQKLQKQQELPHYTRTRVEDLPIPTTRVTIGIPTRDRYEFLSLLLWSIIEQSYPHWDLVIIDDSDKPYPITQIPFIYPMLMKLEHDGHSWCCLQGEKRGVHISHNKIIDSAKTDLILRIDDDCIADKDYLLNLVKYMEQDQEIGAVGGLVLLPHAPKHEQTQPEKWHSMQEYHGKLYEHPNGAVTHHGDLHWRYHRNHHLKPVEHLHSSFLYRKSSALGVGGYDKDFSIVSHNEETAFTYRLHLMRWKLYVCPTAIVWHLKAPSGGIRGGKDGKEFNPAELWEQDNLRFLTKYHYFYKRGLTRESIDIGELK